MNEKSDAARLLGRLGGLAGTGASKVRGDAEYYSRISRRPKPRKRKAGATKSAAKATPKPTDSE